MDKHEQQRVDVDEIVGTANQMTVSKLGRVSKSVNTVLTLYQLDLQANWSTHARLVLCRY